MLLVSVHAPKHCGGLNRLWQQADPVNLFPHYLTVDAGTELHLFWDDWWMVVASDGGGGGGGPRVLAVSCSMAIHPNTVPPGEWLALRPFFGWEPLGDFHFCAHLGAGSTPDMPLSLLDVGYDLFFQVPKIHYDLWVTCPILGTTFLHRAEERHRKGDGSRCDYCCKPLRGKRKCLEAEVGATRQGTRRRRLPAHDEELAAPVAEGGAGPSQPPLTQGSGPLSV